MIVEQGKNVFFTGSAGTGKSFVLRHLGMHLCTLLSLS
jgi:DNA replication protein DnaC